MRRLPEALVLLAALAFAAGCGDKEGGGAADHGHSHEAGPHGGEVGVIGDEVAHLEIVHDHDGGNLTVYVLGPDVKTPIVVEPLVVNCKGPDGKAVQFELTAIDPGPDGRSFAWKGGHAALKCDPWDGRIRVKIGDKIYNPSLEPEGHTHSH